MLDVSGLDVRYGKQQVLRGMSLRVGEGEVVALIGPNAAGKSTTLRTIAGLKVASGGSIALSGEMIGRLPVHARVGKGVVLVPEGRQVFTRLTVRENLLMGAYHRSDRARSGDDMDRICALFPRLKERFAQRAGSMSGGEQQMLAIGRGLMARPRLMLLDEPTLGLAPIVIEELGRTVRRLAQDGLTVLIAEQNAVMALGCSDRAYVLESGAIVLEGTADALAGTARIKEMYLGH